LNIMDNGAVSCSGPGCSITTPPVDQNPFIGGITLTGFMFNGWTITVTAGGSNSPTCIGTNGPGCLNQTDINAISGGAGSLTAYFADTGFTPQGLLTVANATSQQTGATESQQAYAFTGPLPAGLTTQPANGSLAFVPAGGTCGSVETIPAGGVGALFTSCTAPTAPYDLELAETFTASAGGQGFNVNGNIAAVPEPVSMTLFGGGLALLGLARWRRTPKKAS
jgi:hypothetical protein